MSRKKETDQKYAEMTFWEHLEELRWTILKSLIGILIGGIISWLFIDFIIDKILLRPAITNNLTIQNLKPFGQLFLYFQVAFVCGIIISIPNILYQIWSFLKPALRENERKYIGAIVIFSSLCFLAGIVFSYFVVLPFSLHFAAGFGSQNIINNIAVDEYFSIILSIMLTFGLVFELPMVSFFLTKIGILKPSFMRKYRRHSILIIFILAAFLTPTTDPVNQFLLAGPLIILYEFSIIISKFAMRKSERD